MAVIIGSARSNEHGGASGGKPGDQNGGKEVSTQNWYASSKIWRVFRCVDAEKAKLIALAMQRACANNNIGYDQPNRNTLYSVAKAFGFDPGKVDVPVSTDCSALVRVCCAYAGIMLSNFYTSTEPGRLLASGMFVELTDNKYKKKSDYLRAGDILVTSTKGHTAIVLTDGPKAEYDVPGRVYSLGDRVLRNGCTGPDVVELQSALIDLGFDCGSYGADGDFGDSTELAVRKLQMQAGIEIDGEFGKDSFKALTNLQNASEDDGVARFVEIVNGNCYARSAPGTGAHALGVVKRGARLPWLGQTYENGWQLVIYDGNNAWVSGKYAKLVKE